jgi:hypothetical protein
VQNQIRCNFEKAPAATKIRCSSGSAPLVPKTWFNYPRVIVDLESYLNENNNFSIVAVLLHR